MVGVEVAIGKFTGTIDELNLITRVKMLLRDVEFRLEVRNNGGVWGEDSDVHLWLGSLWFDSLKDFHGNFIFTLQTNVTSAGANLDFCERPESTARQNPDGAGP